ncbi:DUF2142 domain-containing protein [Pseudomonas sp. v388]|uniref:DUF2142 domain-containing protein n=1 Tax=Pseudomonas sp. v388 TaxID=2479849 RepID=UPI0035319D2C
MLGALATTYGLSWALPSELAYLAARSFNWLLGAVFICAMFRIAHRAGMSSKAAALTAISVCLIPQVSFVFSYFNSDAFGLMSVALLISALLGFLKSPKKYTALCLGAALGLTLLAKLYFLPALVFVAVMIAADKYVEKRKATEHIGTILVTAAILAGPLLLFTYLKFGEISGVSGQIAFVAMHRENPAAGYGTCYLGCEDNLLEMRNIKPWFLITLMSYFSVTGWMNIFIPQFYYVIAALIFATIVVCAALQTWKSYSSSNAPSVLARRVLPLLMIVGLFPSIIILSLLASQNSLPQPQGRYLFVTIPFMAILIAFSATYHSQPDTNASALRREKFDRRRLKCLILLAGWMAWTNILSWTTNTLSPVNISNSALGMPAAEAIRAVDASKSTDNSGMTLHALAERLSLANGEFSLKIPVAPQNATGHVDEISRSEGGWHFRGWSVVPNGEATARYVIAVEAGKIVGAIDVHGDRPDVAKALNNKAALRSGYEGNIDSRSSPEDCSLQLYTVSSTFEVFAMPYACDAITRLSH